MTHCDQWVRPVLADLERLRRGAAEFARVIMAACSPGREREQALLRLEEAAMWGERAIEGKPEPA
jgi:hypothetical protein